MSRVFANGPRDWGSIPGWVIPKTQKKKKKKKVVIYTVLHYTQHYKVRIEGKMEDSWEWSSPLSYTTVYSS